jgi:hypothetical protein
VSLCVYIYVCMYFVVGRWCTHVYTHAHANDDKTRSVQSIHPSIHPWSWSWLVPGTKAANFSSSFSFSFLLPPLPFSLFVIERFRLAFFSPRFLGCFSFRVLLIVALLLFWGGWGGLPFDCGEDGPLLRAEIQGRKVAVDEGASI